jgi:hypothetical protein
MPEPPPNQMFSADREARLSFRAASLAQPVSTFKRGVLAEFIVGKWLILRGIIWMKPVKAIRLMSLNNT